MMVVIVVFVIDNDNAYSSRNTQAVREYQVHVGMAHPSAEDGTDQHHHRDGRRLGNLHSDELRFLRETITRNAPMALRLCLSSFLTRGGRIEEEGRVEEGAWRRKKEQGR